MNANLKCNKHKINFMCHTGKANFFPVLRSSWFSSINANFAFIFQWL